MSRLQINLTWGWDGKFTKFIPMYIFKTAGVEGVYDKKGGLLLIEKPQFSRRVPWDVHNDFQNYFEDQKKFVSELNSEPMQKLTIRLSKSNTNIKLNEASRWIEFNKSLKIDLGKTELKNLIAESRLVIHTYDTTGLLENFSQNIPTLFFWQNGFDHLRDSVKSDYQILVDSGLLYFSGQSAAHKVNEIWENVDEWWFQKNVQEAKNFFVINMPKMLRIQSKNLATFFEKIKFFYKSLLLDIILIIFLSFIFIGLFPNLNIFTPLIILSISLLMLIFIFNKLSSRKDFFLIKVILEQKSLIFFTLNKPNIKSYLFSKLKVVSDFSLLT